MVSILSWARCSVSPESPSVLEIPATSSFTEADAAAAVYWAFSTSFWVRKVFTRSWSACSVFPSFSSSSVSCWCCGSSVSI